MNKSIMRIQSLFEQGYKCIKFEESAKGNITVYFKNFEIEKTQTLYYDNKEEVKLIKEYIGLN